MLGSYILGTYNYYAKFKLNIWLVVIYNGWKTQ